ncbi:MAG: hypothetical protein EOS56_28470 [Mesorhizobium sp.]|nr:MAG: hypothetical protein EOS56_28470 [Mesorhizobium sp.]
MGLSHPAVHNVKASGTAPPSVLPDISPARGEISCHSGLSPTTNVAEIGEALKLQSPSLRGRWPAADIRRLLTVAEPTQPPYPLRHPATDSFFFTKLAFVGRI